MAGGGLASGLLVYTFAGSRRPRNNAAIDAFHNKRGEIRGRIPIIKTIASAITPVPEGRPAAKDQLHK